ALGELFLGQPEAVTEVGRTVDRQAGDVVDRPGAAQVRVAPGGLLRLVVGRDRRHHRQVVGHRLCRGHVRHRGDACGRGERRGQAKDGTGVDHPMAPLGGRVFPQGARESRCGPRGSPRGGAYSAVSLLVERNGRNSGPQNCTDLYQPCEACSSARRTLTIATGSASICPFIHPSPFSGSTGASKIARTTSMPRTTWPNSAKPARLSASSLTGSASRLGCGDSRIEKSLVALPGS